MRVHLMSALPPKADIVHGPAECLFMTLYRHQHAKRNTEMYFRSLASSQVHNGLNCLQVPGRNVIPGENFQLDVGRDSFTLPTLATGIMPCWNGCF